MRSEGSDGAEGDERRCLGTDSNLSPFLFFSMATTQDRGDFASEKVLSRAVLPLCCARCRISKTLLAYFDLEK